MYKGLFHILILVVLAVAVSCADKHQEKDVIEEAKTTHPEKKQSITKILPREIGPILNSNTEPLKYSNTTLKVTGDFVNLRDIEISEIVKKGKNQVSENIPSVVTTYHLNPLEIRKTRWQVSITFDNDIFANRDYYFTNGFKIELIAPFLNSSPLNHLLIGTKKKSLEQSGFSIAQNMYTPTNPDTTAILYGDHPFSAYLILGQFRETYNMAKRIRIKSELNFGVIGPAAYGSEVQSSIHEKEPVGWINQIENDFIVSYSFKIDKGLVSTPAFEFNLSGRTTIGTLYNKAGGGFNLRAGNFVPVYKGPYSVFQNKNPGGRYQFWIFAEAMVDVIGFDATLQGGMFNKNSIYTIEGSKINRLVFETGLGFALYYNNLGIEYKHYFMTPEFQGALSFSWGEIKAVYAF